MPSRLSRAALGLLLAPAVLVAQVPQERPTFRSGIQTIEVDVLVTDTKGNAQTLQPSQGRPEFEVASVRPNNSDSTRTTYQVPPRGTVTITNATVRQLILLAYEIPPTMAKFKLVGGSDGILSERFDIVGKPAEDAPTGQAELMLRGLLIERFKLRTHVEARQGPTYAVTVAREGKLGPKLRPAASDCMGYAKALREAVKQGRGGQPGPPARPFSCFSATTPTGGLNVRGAGPLELLLLGIQGFVDRPLIDETTLVGNFEWDLTFSGFARNRNDLNGEPPIDVALQEQLGLNLTSRTGQTEVLVIDSVEMPTPN